MCSRNSRGYLLHDQEGSQHPSSSRKMPQGQGRQAPSHSDRVQNSQVGPLLPPDFPSPQQVEVQRQDCLCPRQRLICIFCISTPNYSYGHKPPITISLYPIPPILSHTYTLHLSLYLNIRSLNNQTIELNCDLFRTRHRILPLLYNKFTDHFRLAIILLIVSKRS